MNNWIIKYRLFIIVFPIAITLLSLSFLPKIEVNPNLDSYIPDDIENKIYLKQLDSIFDRQNSCLTPFRPMFWSVIPVNNHVLVLMLVSILGNLF